jgi:hypothetical protein
MVPYIGGTPMNKPKLTPPRRGQFLIPYLERHFTTSAPEETPTDPKRCQQTLTPDLESKVTGPLESKKQLNESKVNGPQLKADLGR